MAKHANAIITKARSMYGRMLTPAQYDELLRKQNVQEISAYLKEKTTYASALSGVQDSVIHRGQLENLLHKDMLYQYVRLIKFVRAKDSIYGYIMMDMEIELILSCLRGIISEKTDEFLTTLPLFVQPYTCFDVTALIGIKTIEQLASLLDNTIYGPVLRGCMARHLPAGKNVNYTVYEQALRTCYFKTMLKWADASNRGEAEKELEEIITIRAEMMNLNTIYRMKMYFHTPPPEIRAALLPFRCRLSRKTLDELIDAKDAADFMQRLSRTGYGKKLNTETKFIESATDEIRYHLDIKLMRFSTDPQVVFIAFMLLRGMETENIIRIVEGVRYQLAPEKIEKLLFKV